jgi:acyl-CoA thioesterase FadM
MREKLGWDLKVISGFACRFVTSKIELEFISPLYVDEEFEIRSSIVEFQGRTCIVELRMLRGNSATCIARSKMELACVDKKSGVPIDWPQNFIEACYATAK